MNRSEASSRIRTKPKGGIDKGGRRIHNNEHVPQESRNDRRFLVKTYRCRRKYKVEVVTAKAFFLSFLLHQ